MKGHSRSPIPTIIFAVLALLLILTVGAVKSRRDYITRGLSSDLSLPISGDGARLGVNVYLEQYDNGSLTETLAEIKAAGIDSVKQSFYYQQNFDWSVPDQLFSEAQRQNVRLVPLLDGNPADSFTPPSDLADFAAWAGEFARRYGDQIDHYIVWDEPNLTTHWGGLDVNPAEYGALLSLTATSIRKPSSSLHHWLPLSKKALGTLLIPYIFRIYTKPVLGTPSTSLPASHTGSIPVLRIVALILMS